MQPPYWYIPSHKDSHYLGSEERTRVASPGYLGQIARAADELGFEGVLVPTGANCEDAWVTASYLAALTRDLKFIVALRPGLVSPTAAARMAATFDRMSAGRLVVNVVGGGDPVELAGDGIFLDHGERYRLMDEFLQIWRSLMAGNETSFSGSHLRVSGANLQFPTIQQPHPRLFMGGSSNAAFDIAARHIDVLLSWGEPPTAVAEKIARAREAAEARGRTMGFGIRLHIVVRDTVEEAWKAADNLISKIDPETLARSQEVLRRTQSVGQRRMNALNGGSRHDLEVSPNLWAGIGLVTGGAGTALVGDPETIANRLLEYQSLGVDTFILSAYPHLEELYRVAETVYPLLGIESDQRQRAKRDLRAKVIPGGW